MASEREGRLGLVCSVALEAAPADAMIEGGERCLIGGKPGVSGTLHGRPVVLLTGGMGKTNAAHALTALFETRSIRGVIGFGVGGAYPGSGLEVGAIALATAEIYGDEGVLTRTGWLSTRDIGIPLVSRSSGPLFNRIDIDRVRLATAEQALTRLALSAVAGPFVTVSSCSGTIERGQELRQRFGAVCETMEGAAYAHVCALYGIPFLEVRGISNQVEDRNLAGWRLEQAAEAAATAVRALVHAW